MSEPLELTPGEDMGEAMRIFDPAGISPRLKYQSVLILAASESARCSPGSAGWTTDSIWPATAICSSANPTRGAARCLPHAGPEFPSTTTYELWVSNQRRELRSMEVSPSLTEPGGFTQQPFLVMNLRGRDGGAQAEVTDLPNLRAGKGSASRGALIFSAAASLARTSPLPDNDAGSKAPAPACSSSSPGSSRLFDPDGYSSRTYPVSSLQTAVGTSEQSLERWPTSGTAWRGGFSTHVSSECRSDDAGCSSSEPSLMEILEEPQNVPAKYSLSGRAAQGILRRAHKRGRSLPSHLSRALETVARTTTTDRPTG